MQHQQQSVTIIRPDGRTSGTSIRPLSCQLHSLSRADGSAQFTCGSTKILAAVYGPGPSKIPSRERLDQAVIVVVFKQARYTHSSSSCSKMTNREMERFLIDSFSACICVHKYPKTIIEIVLQVIQADGSVLGNSINAAVLALMDAGIEMKSIPIGTTCLIGKDNTILLLDPCGQEEEDEEGIMDEKKKGGTTFVLVTDSIQNNIITCMTLGSNAFLANSFRISVDAANQASKAVLMFMRMAIEQVHSHKS